MKHKNIVSLVGLALTGLIIKKVGDNYLTSDNYQPNLDFTNPKIMDIANDFILGQVQDYENGQTSFELLCDKDEVFKQGYGLTTLFKYHKKIYVYENIVEDKENNLIYLFAKPFTMVDYTNTDTII